ncbi:MAG TPA: DUF2167 domain-containing protein [Candidatus Angelobacter sp.]|nr:DUF2167 domain-containing protein [Candidatus Angelobacter sp.]
MARTALKALFVFALLALACSMAALAQEPQSQQPEPQVRIEWQEGPTVGHLGSIAELSIPAGYRFTGKEGAKTVLELTHNIPNGRELGVVIPDSASGPKWFMTFEFEERGYVKDDDKDKLDADALLKSIQDSTESANAERQKHGWKAFHVTGWEHAPYYDPLSHNLTWAIKGRGDESQESTSVNHSIRLLGRRGTMDVDLVVAPEDYAASTVQMDSIIHGFSYVQGNRYSDFTKGDKIAEGGLAALVAVAGIGLLFKFWKPLVVGVVALGGLIKKAFSSIFGSKEIKMEDPNKGAAQG